MKLFPAKQTASASVQLLLVCVLVANTGCSAPDVRPAPTAVHATDEPFLGLALDPDWQGAGIRIKLLRVGPVLQALRQDAGIDIHRQALVAIDGEAVTSDNVEDKIASLRPGETVKLGFNVSGADGAEPRDLVVRVGSRDAWTGPVDKPAGQPRDTADVPVASEETAWVKRIRHETRRHALVEEVESLHALFRQWQAGQTGYHALSRVLFPFQQPYRLIELEQAIRSPIPHFKNSPYLVFNEIALNLDLPPSKTANCPASAIDLLLIENSFAQAERSLQQAFNGFTSSDLNELHGDMEYLLAHLSQGKTLAQQDEPQRSLMAMNASMAIDFPALLQAATRFACFLGARQAFRIDGAEPVLPPGIAGAVDGPISGAVKLEQGWLIIGGPGDNRYDMSQLAAVIDLSGNDTYFSSNKVTKKISLIVDQAGNDRYLADNGGPGAAWLGISILVDHAGNDRYIGELAANGTGVMGIGILVDYAGRDYYDGRYFSNGAGFYGAGILLDLGPESDLYRSSAFSQGFGGPRGFGLIHDLAGNDFYLANYVMPSVYGTPAVFAGFSQGFGFGLRDYDTGGIGMIVDTAGDDRYNAGEFSQGGAYFWGLGILHDTDGHDRYNGNRYSQGFGVHQATGMLIDAAGNDNYVGMTAACQGSAWDIALGLLLDRAGNDSYFGDGLCQGAAAMQAQAWLIDLQGRDHYIATGESVQGKSGTNHYHYDLVQPVYSWSVLLDVGEEADFYSADHAEQNGRTGELKQEKPENSRLNGLFLDVDVHVD